MRQVAGIACVLVAVVTAPAGHFWSPIWWAFSVALVIAGLLLFYSARRVKRELDAGTGSSATFDSYAPGPLALGGARRIDTDSGGTDGDVDGD
jgi:hypothetical protein